MNACCLFIVNTVALHTEGVDRNSRKVSPTEKLFNVALHTEGVDRNSPFSAPVGKLEKVALHTEGVDRNNVHGQMGIVGLVALHTEGVDRNHFDQVAFGIVQRRPPHGGRG